MRKDVGGGKIARSVPHLLTTFRVHICIFLYCLNIVNDSIFYAGPH